MHQISNELYWRRHQHQLLRKYMICTGTPSKKYTTVVVVTCSIWWRMTGSPPSITCVSPMIQWMLGLLWSYRTNVLINLTGILTRRQPETREEVWLSVPDTGDLPNTRVFSVDCYKIQVLTYLGRSFSFLLTDVCTGGAAAFVLADSDLLADSMLAV